MVTVPTAPGTVDGYLGLVPPFNRTKEKFTAMLEALLEPMADLQSFLSELPEQFDVETAVGTQLDVIGEWVGWSRYVTYPVAGVYFTLDDDVLGFDKGMWKGPYDSDTGITRLDDETYRLFLKAKIRANSWDGTMESAVSILADIATSQSQSQFAMFDNQDGSITITITGNFPTTLFVALIDQGYFPLKPEGIRINWEITSSQGAPIFGFDIENSYIAGFDESAWAITPDYFLNSFTNEASVSSSSGRLIMLQVL
ncbi:DUF2612 domain-containing protein [Allorhizobium ampelinum]|uniref:DUF2612 domain-containing protein n=1 Tax=Allorhizobium ampelinum TaxID=3025782 RepID=UPI000B404B15|nr:DUF2612 domain-containing protein [Allorhizobium ampelinum]NTA27387.1 DUF2612 domain-containing protein [Allorhizobium ampelinum]OVE94442.1 hypothetical protein B7W85_12895 [Allorhizobium ampelinum]